MFASNQVILKTISFCLESSSAEKGDSSSRLRDIAEGEDFDTTTTTTEDEEESAANATSASQQQQKTSSTNAKPKRNAERLHQPASAAAVKWVSLLESSLLNVVRKRQQFLRRSQFSKYYVPLM